MIKIHIFLGNVVPPVMSVTFDIRIANDIKLADFEKTVSAHHFLIRLFFFVQKIKNELNNSHMNYNFVSPNVAKSLV